MFEDAADFLTAQNHRKFLLTRGSNKFAGGPLTLQGLLVKEFDTADGNSARSPGPLLDILNIEGVVTQLFLADLGWRFLIVFGELENGSNIRLSGTPPLILVEKYG